MLSMKWYKFLINFGLFAGAFLNLIYGLNYVTGGIYLVQTNGRLSADDIYRHYGESLRYTDIAFGIFLIVFAIFGIVLRNKLAKFKSEAPKLVNVFYASSAVGSLLYSILFSTITSTGFDALQIVSVAVSVIIWFANFKYFRNRKHLFMGRQAIQPMTNVQNSYSLSYSDEKPKTYGKYNVYGNDIKYVAPDEPMPSVDKTSAAFKMAEQAHSAKAVMGSQQMTLFSQVDDAISYDYIKSFLGENNLKRVEEELRIQINNTIKKHNIIRKTDLLKIVFCDITRQFEDRKHTNIDMLICSYYQIAFDSVLKQTGDMEDFVFEYVTSRMSGTSGVGIDDYMRMLVNVQWILDDAITASAKHKTNKGDLARNVQTQLIAELNTRLDEKSGWNNLTKSTDKIEKAFSSQSETVDTTTYAKTLVEESKGLINEDDANAFVELLLRCPEIGKTRILEEFNILIESMMKKYGEIVSVAKVSFLMGVLHSNGVINDTELTNMRDSFAQDIQSRIINEKM